MTVRQRTWHTLYEPKYGKPVKITVWNNKDFESTGREVTVHPKYMKSWNAVLNFLTMTLQPRHGAVRKIYNLDTKKLVCCLDDIQSNGKYIAVGTEKVKFKKNGYLTAEERKARGLTKPSAGWHHAHHLDNVKSLENFMEMTQKNGRTVLYVMVSGRTCQTPLKVVLIERDLLDPKVLLDYLAYRLDVGEGIKYLCNRNGKIMSKHDKLKHGNLYIAVPFSGTFIKMDYAKIFNEILPEKTLELKEVSAGSIKKKRKKKVLETKDVGDYTASAPELETFIDPSEKAEKNEDEHSADFTTFSEIAIEKKWKDLQLMHPPSTSDSPQSHSQSAGFMNKKVSFHKSLPEELFDELQQDENYETESEKTISNNSSEIVIYKIETSTMEIFIRNVSEFLMNNETMPQICRALENSGTAPELYSSLPESTSARNSEIALLKTVSMPIRLGEILYSQENKNKKRALKEYRQWVPKLNDIDLDANVPLGTATGLDTTPKISQSIQTEPEILAPSNVNLCQALQRSESSKMTRQIPVFKRKTKSILWGIAIYLFKTIIRF